MTGTNPRAYIEVNGIRSIQVMTCFSMFFIVKIRSDFSDNPTIGLDAGGTELFSEGYLRIVTGFQAIGWDSVKSEKNSCFRKFSMLLCFFVFSIS